MDYKIWTIKQQLIKDSNLNEGTLKKALALLMERMKVSLNCSGMVIAVKKKGYDWTYKIKEYSANLPEFMEKTEFMEKMYFKGQKLTIYVVATIRIPIEKPKNEVKAEVKT